MPDTFKIGVCMAGAVSAGAYTAGVMDFLIEALEDWESRRGQDGVPSHKVLIDAIGGASAGGMTGIIAASAINNPIPPIQELGNINERHPENKLYHTWVDLVQDDMFPLMLGNEDIVDGKIYSLLNSRFIDDVAVRATEVDKDQWIERPYFNQNLKLFTTLTNLKGFKYMADQTGNMDFNDYLITRHNDYATFILNKDESDYQHDGWIPLHFKTGVNVQLARDSAMATGAFPVGLRSRRVNRSKMHVNDHPWHKDITNSFPITDDPYSSLNVDGGVINNEPFVRVRELIDGVTKSYDTFKGTVLMIDPFPSDAEQSTAQGDELMDVIGGTLSAMLGQLRTKPEVLAQNMDEDDAGQFQIAPRRKINNETREGARAIACGFLGGFGGFLHKEFRIHDFFLGRANCERFLREHFAVPINTSNPIFAAGYQGIPNDQFVSSDGKRRQIIPLFKPEGDRMYMPSFVSGKDWPVRSDADINRFKSPIKKRVGKIVMNFSDYNRLQRVFVWIGNYAILRGKLAKAILEKIKASLKEYELLE